MKMDFKKWMAAVRGEISFTFVFVVAQILILGLTAYGLWWSYETEKFREDVFGIVGLATALAAMLFAFRDAKRQRMETEQIARSMSTRYIGDFPHHVDDIVDVVGNVRKEFRFMADCVDYSSFSYPEGHRRFHDAIIKAKNEGRKIQVLVPVTPAAITHSSPFFIMRWEDLKKTKEYGEFFERYKFYEQPNSREELEKLLRHREDIFKKELLSPNENKKEREQNVEIKTLPNNRMDDTGLFMWLADDRDAVFLLLAPKAETSRVAFRTRDTKIIRSLISIFDSKFNEARQMGS